MRRQSNGSGWSERAAASPDGALRQSGPTSTFRAMRNRLAILALSALLTAPAHAQNSGVPNFLQQLPAQTVVGRLANTAGPAEAIPFSRLAPKIAGITVNSLVFAGATSGTLTMTVPATITSYTVRWPSTLGTAGQGLVTDGIGQLSWAAASGTVDTGVIGNLAYYTASNKVAGNANLNISSSTLTIGVSGSARGALALAGDTSGTTTVIPVSSGGGTLTLPAGTDTIVGRATTDTLTNKTLTAPTINGGTHTAITSLGIRSSGGGAFDLTLANSETLTAGRTLTVTVNDAARTLNLGGNLTTGGAFTTSGAFGVTLTATNTTSLTMPTSGTLATLAGSEALTNKTVNGLTITSSTGTLTIANGKTLTASNTLTFTGTDATSFAFPSGSDTVIGAAATQTLTNKTLTAPTINGGTVTALTSLGIRSTGTGAFDLTVANTENLTAGRSLTVTVNNANRVLNLSGDLTTSGGFTTSGAFGITLTATGATNVTLPTTGTLAVQNASNTFSATNTFSAQNTFSALNQFTDVKFSSGKLYPTADSTTALQVTKADGTTAFVTFDSTNKRIGINKTPGAFDLDVSGAVNIDGALTFGTGTITGLTVNNSPNSSNDYLLYYNAAAGAIRRCTVGSCAAAATAGVSSLNGLTGGLSIAQGTGLSVSASVSTITVALTTARQTLPTTQIFTSGSSATYTTPSNTLWIEVFACGGGAGGGGSGTSGNGAGGAGGNTTFNSVVAGGGNGGAAAPTAVATSPGAGGAGGSGGTGSATDRYSGASGAPGGNYAKNETQGPGGNGGTSRFGGGGAGTTTGAGSGGVGNCSGGGGAAGAVPTTGGAGAGGGGAGEMYYLIINSPSATYTYTVGGAGTAGTAGTSGSAGGAGTAGKILVIEHYGS